MPKILESSMVVKINVLKATNPNPKPNTLGGLFEPANRLSKTGTLSNKTDEAKIFLASSRFLRQWKKTIKIYRTWIRSSSKLGPRIK